MLVNGTGEIVRFRSYLMYRRDSERDSATESSAFAVAIRLDKDSSSPR